MMEPTGGRLASDAGCVGSTDRSNDLISAGPHDLVALRALGKRRRMAKAIWISNDGRLIIEPHDGRKVFQVAHTRTLAMDNIRQAGQRLATIADDEFVVRGAVRISANRNHMRRLLHPKDDSPATLAEVPRAYVIFDVDGATSPIDFDPRNQLIEDEGPPDDPASFIPWEAAIDEFIRAALPRPFHGISCWWQFTASMGFKPGLHMRLLFILDRPMTKDPLTRWLGPQLRPHRLDPAVFSVAQQILVAPPILMPGVTDPMRLRAGWLTGYAHVVVPPTAAEIAVMSKPPPRRHAARPPAAPVIGTPADSKQQRLSFVARLALIGDGPGQDGFHNAILAAVGAWIQAHEWDADTTALQAALADAIVQAPRDGTVHPDAYVAAQINALPRVIADVQQMEQASRAEHGRKMHHVVAPPCSLPNASVGNSGSGRP